MQKNNTAIFIPARLGSTRLENKILLEINNKPIIINILEQVRKVQNVDIYVAVDDQNVFDLIKKYNGDPIMTDSYLPSGTDRIYQALQKLENCYDYIINVQGDMPNISPETIQQVIDLIKNDKYKTDIATIAIENNSSVDFYLPQVVKVVLSQLEDNIYNAIYFSRSPIPYGVENFYSHLGLYAYKADSLRKFVSLGISPLEKIEKLEQLRALENGMKILCGLTKNNTLSVDTMEDYLKAKEILENNIDK